MASSVHKRCQAALSSGSELGLSVILDVVYAQEAELADEQTAAQISGKRLVASVVLVKAPGGCWAGGNKP
jgi:outer membrane protein TolC